MYRYNEGGRHRLTREMILRDLKEEDKGSSPLAVGLIIAVSAISLLFTAIMALVSLSAGMGAWIVCGIVCGIIRGIICRIVSGDFRHLQRLGGGGAHDGEQVALKQRQHSLRSRYPIRRMKASPRCSPPPPRLPPRLRKALPRPRLHLQQPLPLSGRRQWPPWRAGCSGALR